MKRNLNFFCKVLRLENINITDDKIQPRYGQVEIYRKGEWWRLVDTNWTEEDSNVACHYLGFDKGRPFADVPSVKQTNNKPLPIDFKCTGKEKELNDCEHEPKTRKRSDITGVKVICQNEGG